MLPAPELVIAERIELLDEIEVAAELQHRMLAERMMRREESSEFQAGHGRSLQTIVFSRVMSNYGVGTIEERAKPIFRSLQRNCPRFCPNPACWAEFTPSGRSAKTTARSFRNRGRGCI